MNTPDRMLKCRIIAPKVYLSTVINTLYDLGLYHLTPHLKDKDLKQKIADDMVKEGLDIGSPLADAEELSSIIVKIRSLLTKFLAFSTQDNRVSNMVSLSLRTNQKQLPKQSLKEIRTKVTSYYDRFLKLEALEKEVQEKQEQLRNYLLTLAFLKKTKIDIASLRKSQHLSSFLGLISKTEGLTEAIRKVSDECSLALNTRYVLLVGKKVQESELRAVLTEFGFSPLNFQFDFSNVDQEIKKQKEVYKKNTDNLKLLHSKISSIISEQSYLTLLEYQLSEEIRKQELPLLFAVTESTFIAEGWIPKKQRSAVEAALQNVTAEKIHILFEEPGKKDNPPVKLTHSRLVTPFEFLLRLYDLPKYQEIDPTSLLFFTFPLFFGLMLGDFGYGLVLMFLFIYLRKKVPAAKQLMGILIFASVISMIFGLVFGEFFGFESVSEETGKGLCRSIGICLEKTMLESHGLQRVIYEFPKLLNRAHSNMDVFGFEVMTILVIGAVIGFFHLNLGFLLGFLNELKSHGLKHAFMAKISWIILQGGIILAIVASMGIIQSSFTWVGIIIAVSGIILLGLGEGIQGLVEIPAIFSNMLSYMRLGAVGLAGVGLAVVVNEKLALPFIEKGGIFILVGILIFFLGHAINLLLSVIGPFLHGVRLHYVECFSKFFHGGGVEYTPFAKRKNPN